MAPALRAHKIRVADGLVWADLLSDEERTRAARFRFQIDSDRFVAARGSARKLLGDALGRDPRALVFGQGQFGKPFVVDGGSLRFNVSHSGAWVLVALLDGGDVGIDVELARTSFDVMELGASVFSEAELGALLPLQPLAQRKAFFRLWTRKEAALKVWGVGFSLDPRKVHAGVDDAATRVVRSPDTAHPPATVEDMWVDDDHSAAVAFFSPTVGM